MFDYLFFVAFFSSAFSFLLNVFLAYKLFRSKKEKALSKSAQELLSEILSGPTVVRIEVIEKDSILQWKGRF
tara:strand:+ start:1829 stop:2044 length:216 start_codon:yes stop_codon:yes gene_type:complete